MCSVHSVEGFKFKRESVRKQREHMMSDEGKVNVLEDDDKVDEMIALRGVG